MRRSRSDEPLQLERVRAVLRDLLASLSPDAPADEGVPPAPLYPEVFALRTGDRYQLVRVADIDWIEADSNYARLHIGGTERLVNRTLTELETRLLDARLFLRIHRSTIVNLDRVASLEPLFHGEMSLCLRDGTRLVCSRRHRQQLRARIYFTS